MWSYLYSRRLNTSIIFLDGGISFVKHRGRYLRPRCYNLHYGGKHGTTMGAVRRSCVCVLRLLGDVAVFSLRRSKKKGTETTTQEGKGHGRCAEGVSLPACGRQNHGWSRQRLSSRLDFQGRALRTLLLDRERAGNKGFISTITPEGVNQEGDQTTSERDDV